MPKAAVAIYDDIAKSSATGQPLQDLAALRAAMILVDSAPLDEITRRLEPLAQPGTPFRHSARELIALAGWRVNDQSTVRKWSDIIRTDPETPTSVRNRIDVLMALAGETSKG